MPLEGIPDLAGYTVFGMDEDGYGNVWIRVGSGYEVYEICLGVALDRDDPRVAASVTRHVGPLQVGA